MSKKTKLLIAVGGTGGHVLPGCNLAKNLNKNNFEVNIVTDKRGARFIEGFRNLNFYILPSRPIIKNNFITIFFSIFFLFYAVLRSIIFLLIRRPSLVFGMGGYASFPICIASKLLNIRFIIYENNLIIGKANKYLVPFAHKVFVSYKDLEGIQEKYKNKVKEIGNIISEDIINSSKNNLYNKEDLQFKILVLGGSQAAEIFANVLPEIFIKCREEKIPIEVYQQCLSNQEQKLSSLYKHANLSYKIFNFSNNLLRYYSKADLAITRAGSSVLSELVNCNVPFISIPLPSSADKHQLKNAIYYEKKKLGFLIEETDIENSLLTKIKAIYESNSTLKEIRNNQRQYSDKNVYENIKEELRGIINDKN